MKKLFLYVVIVSTLSLCLCTPSYAAIALVAKSIGASTDGEGFATPDIDSTGANFCFVAISNYPGAGGDNDFTDNLGNIYTALTTSTQGGVLKIATWYKMSPTVGAGHHITVNTLVQRGYPAGALRCYSGVVTVSALDTQAQNVGTGVLSVTAGSINPSASTNLSIAALSEASAGVTGMGIDSSFINLDFAPGVSSTCVGLAIADKGTVTPLGGTENPSFTWTTSSDVATSQADFKATGSPPPSSGSHGLLSLGVGN